MKVDLLVHIDTYYGATTHLTKEQWEWPLTHEKYDQLNEEITEKHTSTIPQETGSVRQWIPTITGITPLIDSDKKG